MTDERMKERIKESNKCIKRISEEGLKIFNRLKAELYREALDKGAEKYPKDSEILETAVRMYWESLKK